MIQHNDSQVIAAILEFWFAKIGAGFDVAQQNKLWYQGGVEVDRVITERFLEPLVAAKQGRLTHWTETAEGSLALILLLDQFSRHIYRQNADAFAADALARKVLKQALLEKQDEKLTVIQRSFFYMPLEHSESMKDQLLCVELFQQLLNETPPEGKKIISSSLEFAVKHRDIIELFGRFPHRNEVLGRASTIEELTYLQQGGARFGQ